LTIFLLNVQTIPLNLKIYLEITAVRNITITIADTNFYLKILASMLISGIAMPAPPIIKAITAPVLTPFFINR